MIDHVVKKILSYELIDFICKNIHMVLGYRTRVSCVAKQDTWSRNYKQNQQKKY